MKPLLSIIIALSVALVLLVSGCTAGRTSSRSAELPLPATSAPVRPVSDRERIEKLIPAGDCSRLHDLVATKVTAVATRAVALPASNPLLIWEQPAKVGTNYGIAQYWDVEASSDSRTWLTVATIWNPDPFKRQTVTNQLDARFPQRFYRVGAGNNRREP